MTACAAFPLHSQPSYQDQNEPTNDVPLPQRPVQISDSADGVGFLALDPHRNIFTFALSFQTFSSYERKFRKSERIARIRVIREGFTGKGERMDEVSSSRAPGIATRRVCIADGLQYKLMNLVGEPTNCHTILRDSETRRFQCLCKYEGR